MTAPVSFRIRQHGVIVVKVDGEREQAEASIWHYAFQYRVDGELTIQHNEAGHWKRFALLCQWPAFTPLEPPPE